MEEKLFINPLVMLKRFAFFFIFPMKTFLKNIKNLFFLYVFAHFDIVVEDSCNGFNFRLFHKKLIFRTDENITSFAYDNDFMGI